MRAQIEQRIAELRAEIERGTEELSKLRPRVQYLETVLMRIDGAIEALQGLLNAPEPAQLNPASPYGPETAKQMPWETVAP